VIAFDRGSVPEVIDDGVTGFVVNDVDSAVAALGKVHTLDRALVRATFERRFTSRRMAEDYVDVYESLDQRVPRLSVPLFRSNMAKTGRR
jgi:glycosyltransferase involved in cell wall biosynthesis